MFRTRDFVNKQVKRHPNDPVERKFYTNQRQKRR